MEFTKETARLMQERIDSDITLLQSAILNRCNKSDYRKLQALQQALNGCSWLLMSWGTPDKPDLEIDLIEQESVSDDKINAEPLPPDKEP